MRIPDGCIIWVHLAAYHPDANPSPGSISADRAVGQIYLFGTSDEGQYFHHKGGPPNARLLYSQIGASVEFIVMKQDINKIYIDILR